MLGHLEEGSPLDLSDWDEMAVLEPCADLSYGGTSARVQL